MSTNDFNEIFIFGGTVTSGPLSDVWKFYGLDYSWEKVGKINPRYAFSALNAFFKHQPSFTGVSIVFRLDVHALSVPGIECP